MNKKTFWILVFFILLSLIGLADSIYLTYEHYTGAPLVCIITQGCDTVTTSPQAYIFGVYIAIYGVIYYSLIFFLSLMAITTNYARSANFYKFLIFLTPLGFLASLYFLYLQAFVIGTFCTWCLISAIDSTLLFILGLYLANDNHRSHIFVEDKL